VVVEGLLPATYRHVPTWAVGADQLELVASAISDVGDLISMGQEAEWGRLLAEGTILVRDLTTGLPQPSHTGHLGPASTLASGTAWVELRGL
jgi:hypothetical protein